MSSEFEWKAKKFCEDENPCNGCKPPIRYGGCHSNCDKYDFFKNELERLKEEGRIAKSQRCKTYPKVAEETGLERFLQRSESK